MIQFNLDKDQTEKFIAWRDDPEIHKNCQRVERKTAIGGAVTFHFTPNTLGVGVRASCSICTNEIDLTDYDW